MTSAVRDDVVFTLAKEALPLCFYHTELSVLSKNTLVNAVVVAQFTVLSKNDSFQWPLCPSSSSCASTSTRSASGLLQQPQVGHSALVLYETPVGAAPTTKGHILNLSSFRKCVHCPFFPWFGHSILSFLCLSIQSLKASVIKSTRPSQVDMFLSDVSEMVHPLESSCEKYMPINYVIASRALPA